MAKNLGERLRRLEVAEQGEGRVIVVVWPKADADAALLAKGIVPRNDDLIVNITKEVDDGEGWVSVNGLKVA